MVGTYSRVPSTFCLMLRFFFLFNAQIFCLLYTAMQNFSSMDTISHLAKKNGQMDVALFSGQHSGGSTFKSPTRLRCVSVLLSFSFIVQSLIKQRSGEVCVANFKAPLRMVQVWTGLSTTKRQLLRVHFQSEGQCHFPPFPTFLSKAQVGYYRAYLSSHQL